ncbi:MAG: holo-ACP synthase [Saccharofermentanales bacterium]
MRTGVDLVSVSRIRQMIADHGDRFMDRVYTPAERAICAGDARRFAGRYAAKEAVSKALGTGIGRRGITFQDLEILQDSLGAPVLHLHRAARTVFDEMGGLSVSLSISHEHDYALAFCVIGLASGQERLADHV